MISARDDVVEHTELEDEGGGGGVIVDANDRYTSPRRRRILGYTVYPWVGRFIGRLCERAEVSTLIKLAIAF